MAAEIPANISLTKYELVDPDVEYDVLKSVPLAEKELI